MVFEGISAELQVVVLDYVAEMEALFITPVP